ncbi:MAG: hypothetical protein H6742_04005 [Alphaproteobacteria bacterium]|nr:hypothetical protein [Alphaproteobacteria bacterium]
MRLFLALLSLPALAGPVERAEAERLSAELRSRVTDARWQAAADSYGRLAALGDLAGFDDHWRGLQAARAVGDMALAWTALQAASDDRPTDPDVLRAEGELLAWYGPVDLRVSAKVETVPELTLEPVPMDPTQRQAWENARASLQTHREYHGLLPLGMYELGDQHFEVLGDPAPVQVRLKR